MPFKLLALDLDGTLTNAQKAITVQTKNAVWAAIDKGVTVVLASGRPAIGIQNVAATLRLDELGGYILAYNGGQIIDCKTGNVIYEKTIGREMFSELYDATRIQGITLLTYNESSVITDNKDCPYVIKEAYNNAIPIFTDERFMDMLPPNVTKFMAVGAPEKTAPALEKLRERFTGRLNISLSEPYFIEISPVGVEKASALGQLLAYLGQPIESLIAIGDGLNDIPMLEFAGFAVAMGNAYPETKAIADYITKSNDEDGVALAIERFIL